MQEQKPGGLTMTNAPSQPINGHTPTPWVADPDWREGYSWNIHILDAANPDMRICFMTSDGPAEANAALIVEAVNNYAALKARVAELEGDLGQALRQWKMYAEMTDDRDLASEKSAEADLYRAALSHAGPVARDKEST